MTLMMEGMDNSIDFFFFGGGGGIVSIWFFNCFLIVSVNFHRCWNHVGAIHYIYLSDM